MQKIAWMRKEEFGAGARQRKGKCWVKKKEKEKKTEAGRKTGRGEGVGGALRKVKSNYYLRNHVDFTCIKYFEVPGPRRKRWDQDFS